MTFAIRTEDHRSSRGYDASGQKCSRAKGRWPGKQLCVVNCDQHCVSGSLRVGSASFSSTPSKVSR